MLLTARQAQTAKPRPNAYGIADGGGLTLWITPDDHRYWHFRYRMGGKQPRISLGTYPAISLQQFRERAAECRALVANGIDPRKKRRDDKHRDALVQINTFKAAAEYWYKHKAEAGRAAATLAKIRTYLDKDILPELGDKPLQHITYADCAMLQERIENRDAHNVAKKPGAGSNKSSARPLRAGFAKTILRLSFAPLQQRRRRSSTTLTCSNLNCPNF